MMKFLHVPLAMTFLVTAGAEGFCDEPVKPSAAALFRKADLDGDGRISLKEFHRVHSAQRSAPVKTKNAAKRSKVVQSVPNKHRRRRRPRGVVFDNPYLQHQVVDVDDLGNIRVVCTSDSNVDPADCEYDGDGDGEPDADRVVVRMFAKLYSAGDALPFPGCPPTGAVELEDNDGDLTFCGDVPDADSSETYPLPQMTLCIWEKIEFVDDDNAVVIDECTKCPPYAPLIIYGHKPVEYPSCD